MLFLHNEPNVWLAIVLFLLLWYFLLDWLYLLFLYLERRIHIDPRMAIVVTIMVRIDEIGLKSIELKGREIHFE
jgi:hypothetical protein